MSDTLWVGRQADKLYLQSGQFTSTLKTSEYVGGVDAQPSSISWDGTNTPWCGFVGDKLYLQSGQFTSTLKTSEYIGGVQDGSSGISWDGTNTPWCGSNVDKLYLQSGQFTSTIKDSESLGGVETNISGISWDGTNAPWCGYTGDKLYLQSGQFTSTIKTSEDLGGVDNGVSGISWDGTNTPWCGYFGIKLYLQSGQFTSTIKDSESISGVDTFPFGIEHGSFSERVTSAAVGVTVPRIRISHSAHPHPSQIKGRTFRYTVALVIPPGTPPDGTNTLWCGKTDDKLYLQSGQFTSTLKTSKYIGGVDASPQGISWDGTNTPWCGDGVDKLFLQSGQFTSTIKTSESIGGIDSNPQGISWDGTNTPWIGRIADKLYLQSGQFTSTLKTSEYIGGVEGNPVGISWDGTNTPWCGFGVDKLFLQSGQFTSTLKTSEYVGGVEVTPSGISWDGTNTPWIGSSSKNLYLTSGQFTSTIKTSENISGIDTQPWGIGHGDFNARVPPPLIPRFVRVRLTRPVPPHPSILRGRTYRWPKAKPTGSSVVLSTRLEPTVSRNEDGTWSFTWPVGSTPYSIWLEGLLIAEGLTTESYEFDQPGYEDIPPDLEIINSPAENELYPPFLILQWRGLQSATAYIVEEYVSGSWVAVGERQEESLGYYKWTSPSKVDASNAQFRVTAIDLYGNGGTPITFATEIVRNPAAPSVSIDIGSSGDVIVSAA